MKPKSDAERSERLSALYTGAISDILDALGPEFRNQCLPPDIRPLEPTMKVAGPAFPVRGRARHYDDGKDPRYKQMDMLDAIFPNCVVVRMTVSRRGRPMTTGGPTADRSPIL